MTARSYGDDDAWIDRPRDYWSLVSNFVRMHDRPMPGELVEHISDLKREGTA